MSDRTHQYRQLGRRDPATTAEMFARDADGNQVPLVTSADGKLIVEVSGGGGGSGVIQGRDELGFAHDVRVDGDGRLVIEGEITVDQVGIQGEGPSGPVDIAATVDGRLAVQTQDDALVAIRAVGPGGAMANLQTSADGLLIDLAPGVVLPIQAVAPLPVEIQSSVTVPVEVQGVAEVKATSLSVWNFGKANGAFTHPDVTDADGWMDLRAFSRLSATAIASGYTYDLAEGFLPYGAATVHVVTDWTTLTAAITAAASGDVILLRNGSYTMPSATALAVNKPLTLIGESREGVFIETPVAVTAGLNAIIAITSSDVTIASLTVRWQHLPASPSNQSCITALAGTGLHYSRIRLENLRIEYVEMGIMAKIADSRIASCAYVYTGAAGNGHRANYIRSIAGNNEIIDNTFDTGLSNDLRFIHLTHDTGGTATGRLSVCRNTQLSPLSFQFIEISAINGVANGFDLVVSDNYSREQNAFIIFSGLTAGRIDFVNSVTIARNDIANGTVDGPSTLTGKGVLGFDAGAGGTVVIRASGPLPVYEAANTIVHTGLRTDSDTNFYASIYGGSLVAARGTSGFSVTPSSTIPAETYPAATGSNLLIYWSGNLQVQYKVVDAEPVGQTLLTTAINGAYHAIIDPTDPQDILGIGRVRLVASGSIDLGGYYAAFAVAK